MKKRIITKKNVPDTQINDADLEFTKNPGDEHSSDPFLHSLDKLSEKDIPASDAPEMKNKKKKKSSPVTTAVLILSCAVFVVCAVYLVFNLIDKKQGSDMYNDLASNYFGGISFEGDASASKEEEEPDLRRGFSPFADILRVKGALPLRQNRPRRKCGNRELRRTAPADAGKPYRALRAES